MTGGHWYNKSICNKSHGKVFEVLLEMQELTDIISCALLMHMKKSINNLVIMTSAVEVVHYHQIQQQNH